ncbi:hypothetical protein ACFX14_006223 [Malus domestica]
MEMFSKGLWNTPPLPRSANTTVATPGLVATSGEDGCVCWFDRRCKYAIDIIEVGEEPILSLRFRPGNENMIYVASGKQVESFDVRLGSSCSWKLLESFDYNKEEINQIACSCKSYFLAALDDSGEINIIDILHKRIYKTLRDGHTSICSTAQFLPWKPWEVITGGLDSKLVMWDFSKGLASQNACCNLHIPLSVLLGRPHLDLCWVCR